MNGKPVGIDTQYIMKSAEEFDRGALNRAIPSSQFASGRALEHALPRCLARSFVLTALHPSNHFEPTDTLGFPTTLRTHPICMPRFIRFMDRFAAAAELGFTEAGQKPASGGGAAKSQAV